MDSYASIFVFTYVCILCPSFFQRGYEKIQVFNSSQIFGCFICCVIFVCETQKKAPAESSGLLYVPHLHVVILFSAIHAHFPGFIFS